MIIARTPTSSSELFFPYSRQNPTLAYWFMDPDFEDQAFSLGKKQGKVANKETDPEGEQAPKRAKVTATPTSKLFPIAMNGFDIQTEDDNELVLSTDLPGVKQADVTLMFKDGAIHIEAERKKGTAVQTFRRKLVVDEDAIDVDNLRATLEDGILTVHVPQKTKGKQDKSAEDTTTGDKTVVVVSKDPPEQPFELNMEIDVPGVKHEDLKVVLTEDGNMLTVSGERKRSGGKQAPSKMAEAYVLNKRKLDTSRLEAYLVDGVLTIRAPAKPKVEKTIAVNRKLPPTKDIVEE